MPPLEWLLDLLRGIGSEPLKVRFAFYTGIAAGAAALLAALWTILLRLIYRYAEKRRKNVKRRWTEVLLDALDGASPTPPRLPRRDRRTVVGRFNYLFETLTGEAHQQLRAVAHQGHLDEAVLEMIDHRNTAESLAGTVAAGHLRSRQAIEPALRKLDDPRPALSLAAAHALMRIDARAAAGPVVDAFGRRPDWHVTRVADVLEGGGPHLGNRLARLLELAATVPDKIRFIECIEAIGDAAGTDVLRALLTKTARTGQEHRHVVAAGVRALSRRQDPRDADLIARFQTHPDAGVRRETATALGRVGDTQHTTEFIALITDVDAWVRYEAARAFLSLPDIDDDRLMAVLDAVADPVARAGLQRAIAERTA